MEVPKRKDVQDGARNKTTHDALQEEGYARFWPGVCLKEREKSKNRKIRERNRNSYETLTARNREKA